MKENTLDALIDSISNSNKIKNFIIGNCSSEEKKEIRLNLVYLIFNFNGREILIQYYAADESYPDVEISFDDFINIVKNN
ncbi:hypothetical protein CUZ56_02707 [Saezia sanguinis]|uniref:Uncharacterized protein n=1 Tax=Saezia sanguinis TaxID=1965230 RepID=A0A433SA67_9BURK|nr:hypothetical protein [Saezia sanguinis]RUS65621.1 hypothetical protein CUZ56_02707 [Saezia sanguinis]